MEKIGLNITIEGPDGGGKTSLIKSLSAKLIERGLPVETYRHPGTTPLGQEIRNITKHRADLSFDRYTEQVLMAADITDFVQSRLKPAIAAGKVVISDRSNLISGMVYGLAGGLNWNQIKAFQNVTIAADFPKMHLIVLNADYDMIKSRQHHDIVDGKEVKCKIQSRGEDFHRKVANTYVSLANVNSLLFDEHRVLYDRLREFTCEHMYNGILPTGQLSVWPINAALNQEEVLQAALSAFDQIVELQRLSHLA